MRLIRFARITAAALLAAIASPSRAQQPATTVFTYQGRLLAGGVSQTALYDFQFKLFDALAAGNQIGPTLTQTSVQVTGGLFTVALDFGAAFDNQRRWLHIGVRPAGGTTFTALVPRQELTAAPQAEGLVLPFVASTPSTAAGIAVTGMGANGTGLYGECDNGLLAYGVWGYSTSGFGVVGDAVNGGTGGQFTSDSGVGLRAKSASSHAVYGENGIGSGIPPIFGYGTGIWGDSDNGNGLAGTSGTGFGIYGAVGAASGLNPPSGAGVVGDSHAGAGVVGMSTTSFGVYGVRGSYTALAAPAGAGVLGQSHGVPGVVGLSDLSDGLYAAQGAASGVSIPGPAGVYGDSHDNTGVLGTSNGGRGVSGISQSSDGVAGISATGVGVYGLHGVSTGSYFLNAPAIFGDSRDSDAVVGFSINGDGVFGETNGAVGVEAFATTGVGLHAQSSSNTNSTLQAGNTGGGPAAAFLGDVFVLGNLSKGGGSFKIDHPLDPENKYLYHSFVESPDMKDVYDGVVTTDGRGCATVMLPDWFEALNSDFRYQLTVVDESNSDEFVQVKVTSGVSGNRFSLRASRAGTVVSWQVTGIRRDAYANAHRIPVEEYKAGPDRGRYLYPAEAGQRPDRGIGQQLFPPQGPARGIAAPAGGDGGAGLAAGPVASRP